jgi:hypothetical protein
MVPTSSTAAPAAAPGTVSRPESGEEAELPAEAREEPSEDALDNPSVLFSHSLLLARCRSD